MSRLVIRPTNRLTNPSGATERLGNRTPTLSASTEYGCTVVRE